MATLCLSNGVPMITAGDERGRTQRGNNNAYCQDNEISWVDWRPDDAWLDVYEITRTALRLRREHPALRQRHWFEGRPTIAGGPKDLAWLHPDRPRDDRRRLARRAPARGRHVRLRRPAALPRAARRAAARQVVPALAQRRGDAGEVALPPNEWVQRGEVVLVHRRRRSRRGTPVEVGDRSRCGAADRCWCCARPDATGPVAATGRH